MTYGSYKTAEILFSATVSHFLAMYLHYKHLGVEALNMHLCGSKSTERIISELQGKTNQLQSLNAQPTQTKVLQKVSKVQFNQQTEEAFSEQGIKKAPSTNHKRMASLLKVAEKTSESYPDSYNDFLESQRKAHLDVVADAKTIFLKFSTGSQVIGEKE